MVHASLARLRPTPLSTKPLQSISIMALPKTVLSPDTSMATRCGLSGRNIVGK